MVALFASLQKGLLCRLAACRPLATWMSSKKISACLWQWLFPCDCTWSSIELEGFFLWARCSSYSLSAGWHHSEAAGPRLRTARSIAKEMPLQLEKHMLIYASNCGNSQSLPLTKTSPCTFCFIALVGSIAALRFCVLGSLWPMTTARKMRSSCCLQRDRLFSRGAIETMF